MLTKDKVALIGAKLAECSSREPEDNPGRPLTVHLPASIGDTEALSVANAVVAVLTGLGVVAAAVTVTGDSNVAGFAIGLGDRNADPPFSWN